jgi:glycosyltransferase involved in cell wall biosynthesis
MPAMPHTSAKLAWPSPAFGDAMTPRVSVLIGAYNHAHTLERAVRSMLQQTVNGIELLIIDDGSSDATAEVAAGLAAGDSRVRVLSMGSNAGIAQALNAGISQARAPIVAVLDADDWSEPDRLERQLDVLERRPEVAVVGCRMREVDEHGRELAPRTRLASGDVTELLMRYNPIPNSSAAFRRAAALSLGGYDPRYRWAPEYDLWLRLAERHRLFALEETLATREMSTSNVAATRERAQIGETILMRERALRRRHNWQGATGLIPALVSYVTPIPVKRAARRRLGQAP